MTSFDTFPRDYDIQNKNLFLVENISNGKVTLLEWFFYIIILLSNTKVCTYIVEDPNTIPVTPNCLEHKDNGKLRPLSSLKSLVFRCVWPGSLRTLCLLFGWKTLHQKVYYCVLMGLV